MPRNPASMLARLAGLALLLGTPVLWGQDNTAPARVKLIVPAGAVVEIEGVKTKQTGPERSFVTPALTVGKGYIYNVKVSYTNSDGKPVVDARKVRVVGGQETTVDFRPTAVKTTDKTEVKKSVEKTPSGETTSERPDVPFVPTPQPVVDKMLEMANVTDKDVVYDLGCGDGRIVVTAAKNFGAKGVGIDINPKRVKASKENVQKAGVEKLVEIRQGNIFKIPDLGKATVVTLYLLPEVNLKLMPELKKLKPGTRIVSHDFDMGDWKPLKETTVTDKGIEHQVYLWMIGAENKGPIKKEEKPAKKEAAKTEEPKKEAEVKEKTETKEVKKPRLDVPYVPTPQDVVDKMLELGKVGKNDVLYDLGCGDGRIVVTAAKKFGCKAVGIDLDPQRVKESRENVKKAGVEKLVEIREGNALKVADIGKASIVTLYLLPEVNLKLRPILQKELKPGSRIVSHDFDMGDWKPVKEVTMKDSSGDEHSLYLWNIPAKKEGARLNDLREKIAPPTLVLADKDKKDEDKEPDVIFVPTPQAVVDKMLELANVKKDDVVYDLGCGDGRIPVTAAKKFGVKAFGFDVDPQRIKESNENVKKNKVEKLVTIAKKDIFTLDLSPANVVTLYLLPRLNVKLIPQLDKLKPGSRIVSHDFDMEGVKPDKVVHIKAKDDRGNEREHTIYLFTVPLKKEKEEKKGAFRGVRRDLLALADDDKTPDVIYVPTPQPVVDKMLELANVKKGDVVYDLGCGDGRIPVTAAKKFGVKAWGFDVDPQRIKESNENVKKNKVEKLVTITKKDIFTLDLSPANVVTLYLLPSLNVKLIPQLEKLKPGSRIITHDFDMRGVKPDKVIKLNAKDDNGNEREHTIYVFSVPLKKEKE